eukprot:c25874_g1_i1 orf=409-1509(+)
MASISVLVLVLGLGVMIHAASARPLDVANDIVMVTDTLPEVALREGRYSEILGESPMVHHFTSFAKSHGKVYISVEELHHRFAAFVESVELIESTNRKRLPYHLGINQFADWTWDEFRQTYLMSGQQNCSATIGNHKLTDAVLPDKRDWREDGIVSLVKDQGKCGSCWTFSTTGALESAHSQASGQMVLLSEQQLVDCAGGYNNFGCGGGLPSQAFEYIRFNGGLDTENAYPYTGKNGVCHFQNGAVGAKVYDVVNITMGAEYELKHAVGLMRPVSVAFEVIKEFRLYKGGIFSSSDCHDRPETVNHAVLAVGYNVDKNGIPYWIIKNSWGPTWGSDGFFNMEMGKNMCGIATCASYPVVPEDLNF